MQELLKVNYDNDRITLSARELHEFLGVETPFKKWFGRMCEYGFDTEIDYQEVMDKIVQNPLGGRPSTDYQITIEMAKEIAMLQRSEKGKQVRQYFISLEKKWNSPEFVMKRALEYSHKQVERLMLENEELKSKAFFADTVSASEDSILIGQLAKIISQNGHKIGQNRLFRWMRENGYLMNKGENFNLPTQKSMELGLMEIKERTVNNPDGSIRITKTTKITGKGQVYFVNKFLSNNEFCY
ncbi:phage antirepressor KilAC domain-containing protein [Amedibacillus dolichus]|uniref:phage antirepressor KilAC domain-containing protein n=1 Tax=Amedibacillus dolichus TaxID=31971 RepID=UPI001D00A956|nr:phage antirepressor KilAC domain-containing protein [Amedibacillus dolichus]MCB5373488.1 phage antirepressor KilAC domain-containing protein [Amedibacillus dolichus]